MITDTIQNALKRLFCSIGGNADNVRNKDDINAILDEMTALNIGKKISSAGTNVVANPTLAGTEADLEGLQVGDTKYKIGGSSGGGSLVVTLTSTVVDEQEVWSTDKTAGEIFAALPGVVLLETKDGLTSVRPIIAFTTIDGYGYIVQYLEVSYDNQAHFTGRFLYATSADAIMTTEEPSDPSDPSAE